MCTTLRQLLGRSYRGLGLSAETFPYGGALPEKAINSRESALFAVCSTHKLRGVLVVGPER
jgi:hypothetical protein